MRNDKCMSDVIIMDKIHPILDAVGLEKITQQTFLVFIYKIKALTTETFLYP